ncbi:MAG TPA: DUF6159 family protein [Solirubrobacteraceae bacterium]|jgi:hypothetical protein|nr:DUF6159 family protein [Solirubrobacteraceae bacterium]
MSEAQSGVIEPPREGRIARSWRLTRAAWDVVRGDRSLLALAAVSVLAGGIGLALIFVLAGSFGHDHVDGGKIALFALIFAYPLTFVSVFLNTAIAAAAAAALEGRHLSLGEALAVPLRKIGQVALWALIAAVVGYVLEQLASRLPLGGSIAARIVGVGWSLASLFAIPIIALEDCSAQEALRRSARTVKQRWGETIGGSLIIGAWAGIAALGVIVVFAVAIVATNHTTALRDALIVLGVLALVAIVALQIVVRQTFSVALYRYATNGAVPGPFEEHDLQSPFGRKRGRQS